MHIKLQKFTFKEPYKMDEKPGILKENLVNSVQKQIYVIIEYYEGIIEQLKSEKSNLETDVKIQN